MRSSRVSRTGRSLGGCIGCRKRKRKCDETHPECNECTRRGLKCPGFKTTARFLPYEPQGRKFSWSGTSSVPDPSLPEQSEFNSESGNSTLAETFCPPDKDAQGKSLEGNAVDPVFQNSPFDTFWPTHEAPMVESSPSSEGSLHPSLLVAPIANVAYDWEGNLATIGSVQESDMINGLDSAVQRDLASHISDIGGETHGSQELIDLDQTRGYGIENRPLEHTFAVPRPQSSLNPSSHLSVSASTASIVHLMGHYRDIAGTFFSPRRTTKLPWVVMHLPTATSTLSKIAAGGKPKFVQTALLNAVLSVSAFNLDKMIVSKDVPSDIWWVLGQSFRSHGKLDMQKHLSQELFNPDSTQYIETLMALLTMATSSIIGGQLSEVRSFLLDAETCICRYVRKGDTSNLSQTSMLHQIFLFQRIIEESTFIYPEWATCAPPTGPAALEYRTLRFPSLQTVYFRRGITLPRSFPSDLESVLRGGSAEDAEASSTFEDIYGIPESLLSLLSKATSLSNEIMAHKGRGNEPLLNPDLIVRSKELETDILQWRTTELAMDEASYVDMMVDLDTEFDSSLSETGSSGGSVHDPLTPSVASKLGLQASTSLNLAIHHALLLYFYRRTSNLDPALLQFHVDAVMKLLRHCRHEMVKVGIINCGIVWPGFLAATEALGHTRQAAIRSFLHESTRISGMRSFDVAMDVAVEVWRLRAEKGNTAVSWVDVLADQGRTVVLT